MGFLERLTRGSNHQLIACAAAWVPLPGPATVNAMSDAAPADDQHDVTCPHCHKPFSAELIAGATARHRGFKCPHCRLFVPLTRANEQAPAKLSG